MKCSRFSNYIIKSICNVTGTKQDKSLQITELLSFFYLQSKCIRITRKNLLTQGCMSIINILILPILKMQAESIKTLPLKCTTDLLLCLKIPK